MLSIVLCGPPLQHMVLCMRQWCLLTLIVSNNLFRGYAADSRKKQSDEESKIEQEIKKLEALLKHEEFLKAEASQKNEILVQRLLDLGMA